jgi:transposase
MTATTTQYTAEQTTQMVAQYTQGVSVEFIAETLGKSVRSVIAKLSREGVYTPKAKVGATERVTKAQLIDQIAASLEVSAEKLESLEKATKEALALVALAIAAK